MGSMSSSFLSDEEKNSGYHISEIQIGSPAWRAGLEPFFDYIVSLGNSKLTKDGHRFRHLLKANIGKAVNIEVFNSKTQRMREVVVKPSSSWGGEGLLGASVRYCSYEKVNENVWHVLDVDANSPASRAGLIPHTDFIIGADHFLSNSEDFFSLVKESDGTPLKLLVYNTETDQCRGVVVTPNAAWGGEGCLGCGIGFGYLHRIPIPPAQMDSRKRNWSPQPAVTAEEGVSADQIQVSFMPECGQPNDAASQMEAAVKQNVISSPQQATDPDMTLPMQEIFPTKDESVSAMIAHYGDDTADNSYNEQRPSSTEKEKDLQQAMEECHLDLSSVTVEIANDTTDLKTTTENTTNFPDLQEGHF